MNMFEEFITQLEPYKDLVCDNQLSKNTLYYAVNEEQKDELVFIFKETFFLSSKKNELTVSINGNVKNGYWEKINNENIFLSYEDKTYHYEIMFFVNYLIILKKTKHK